TTRKVKKKTVTALKPIGLSSVVPASSATTTSVALVPARKINLTQTDELEIIAAELIDAQGGALDGNDDGIPGGNFVAAFSRNGLTSARRSAILHATRLSGSAVDTVLQHETLSDVLNRSRSRVPVRCRTSSQPPCSPPRDSIRSWAGIDIVVTTRTERLIQSANRTQ